MGCWNETCMVSRLPILYGLRCCGVLAVHTGENNNMSYTTNAYKPISPIFEGEYDDYGSLSDVSILSLRGDIDQDKMKKQVLETLLVDPTSPLLLSKKQFSDEDLRRLDDIHKDVTLEQLLPFAERQRLYMVYNHKIQPVVLLLFHKKFYDMAVESGDSWGVKSLLEAYHLAPDGHDSEEWEHVVSALDFDGVPSRPLRKLAKAGLPLENLAIFQRFLSGLRIGWAPTVGKGSQRGVYPDDMDFYQAVCFLAEDLMEAGESDWL